MRLIDANSIMRKMADMLNESGNPLYKQGWLFSHFFGESVDPEQCEVVGNIFGSNGGAN